MTGNELLDQISQCGVLLSVLATWLVARKNKWGFVVGLCSQPFWLYTSYHNAQYGILLNSIVFTGVWAYGVYEWFWGPRKIVT